MTPYKTYRTKEPDEEHISISTSEKCGKMRDSLTCLAKESRARGRYEAGLPCLARVRGRKCGERRGRERRTCFRSPVDTLAGLAAAEKGTERERERASVTHHSSEGGWERAKARVREEGGATAAATGSAAGPATASKASAPSFATRSRSSSVALADASAAAQKCLRKHEGMAAGQVHTPWPQPLAPRKSK